MTEKNILIYHHNDLDGFGAAAAVCYGMKLHAGKDVELNFEFRSIAFPTIWETFVNEDIEPREFNEVVIVDYGFTTNNEYHLHHYCNKACSIQDLHIQNI